MRDCRLHQDPPTRAYREKLQARRSELRAQFPQQQWETWAGPLVEALSDVPHNRGVPDGDELPPELAGGFSLALQAITRDGGYRDQDDAAHVFLVVAGEVAGTTLAESPAEWIALFRKTLPWELVESFCSSLPPAAVTQHVEMLATATARPWQDSTHGSLDFGPDVIARVNDAIVKIPASDPWNLAAELHRTCSHLLPDRVLRCIADLCARAGPAIFLHWLHTLPHPILQSLASGTQSDLRLLLCALRDCGQETPADLVVPTLLAERIVRCLEQIDSALAHAADTRWRGHDDRPEVQEQELGEWRTNELPTRVAEVAEALACPGLAEIAYSALRGFLNGRKDTVRDELFTVRRRTRSCLVENLVKADGLATFTARILATDAPTLHALTAASLGLFADAAAAEVEQPAEQTLDSYREWLLAEEWHFSGDEDEDFSWALAGVLCLTRAPIEQARRLFDAIPYRDDGWSQDTTQVFADAGRRAHVLTVSAMCLEWLERRKPELCRAFFDAHWPRLHQWARSLPNVHLHDKAHAPLLHTWARLPLVVPAEVERLANEQLCGIDELECLLACLQNLKANLASKQLTESTVRIAQSRVRLMRVTWNRRRVVDPAAREATLRLIFDLGLEMDSTPGLS